MGLTFIHPHVLWFLLLIPLLAVLKGRIGRAPGVLFSSTAALQKIGAPRKSRWRRFFWSWPLLTLLCFGIAFARPQLGKTLTRVYSSGIDIFLAIDVSGSMLSEDFTNGNHRASRLDAVKQVVESFINQRPHDRMGMLAFAGHPYLVSPLTLDHDWLVLNQQRLQVAVVDDGTAIGSAIAVAVNRLKDQVAKTKLIVLLTDGENNAGKVSPLTAAEAAQALGIRVYTIGAGRRGFAPYPVKDPFGHVVYRNVPVDVDEKSLEAIAKLTGGEYFRATDTRSLQDIFRQIDQLEKSTVEMESFAQHKDLFPGLIALGLLFLLIEVVGSQTVWRRIP